MRIRLGAKSFTRAAADIDRASKRLVKEIEQGLRRPAQAARDDIRQDILTANMAGHRTRSSDRFDDHIASKGVRRPTARAVQAKVSIVGGDPQASIVFHREQVPPRIRQLVPYWTGTGRRRQLRHPIMGNRSQWAGQNLPMVWRLTNENQFEQAVDGALGRIVDIAEGG